MPRFVDIEDDSLGLDPAAVDGGADAIGRGRSCRSTSSAGRAGSRQIAAIAREPRAGRSSRTPARASARRIDGQPLGSLRRRVGLRVLPEQADHDRRRRDGRDRRPGAGRAIASLRNQGRDADGTWLRHVRLGYNYRLDELSAAVGVAQIERLAELRPAARRVAAPTSECSAATTGSACPSAGPGEIVDWFVYVVRLDAGDRPRRGHGRARRARRRRPGRTSARSTSSRSTGERFGFRAGRLPGHRAGGGLDARPAVLEPAVRRRRRRTSPRC